MVADFLRIWLSGTSHKLFNTFYVAAFVWLSQRLRRPCRRRLRSTYQWYMRFLCFGTDARPVEATRLFRIASDLIDLQQWISAYHKYRRLLPIGSELAIIVSAELCFGLCDQLVEVRHLPNQTASWVLDHPRYASHGAQLTELRYNLYEFVCACDPLLVTARQSR